MIHHYLRSWHNAVKKDILFEWKMGEDGQRYRLPREEDINFGYTLVKPELTMPFWAMAVGNKWRENIRIDAHKSFVEAYKNTEEGRELEKTWRHDMSEDKDFVKIWLAGPGQKWQK
jgi:hypothetical protein